MEFLSLYSLQMNRVMSAMLRLTEIKDVLRQMSHLPRKDLINFADLPRSTSRNSDIGLYSRCTEIGVCSDHPAFGGL